MTNCLWGQPMQSANPLQSIDRRTFLKILSFTGIAGLAYPRHVISSVLSPLGKSRVVVVKDDAATEGLSVNSTTIQSMVEAGIKSLAQQEDLNNAWKTILPGVNQNSVIAIKVNCINGALPTHPQVTYAVANTLQQMDFDGTAYPENNIIIFDRRNWELESNGGYTLNTSNSGIRCFGTNSSGVGYSSRLYDVHGSNQRLSRIVTDMADYLINISVLKNHGGAGVTLCMKNHYGTCNDPGAIHGNNCDPFVPVLNTLAPIKEKQKLNICDALLGVKAGGPGGSPQFTANKIIFSQDIVALDSIGRQILADNGCRTINKAHHVDTATSYGLGTNDPNQMDVVNITNPTADINTDEGKASAPESYVLEQNFPNPFNSYTLIRFYVDRAQAVRLEIYDYTGRYVTTLMSAQVSAGWHQVRWQGLNAAGKPVASGIYLCQLTGDEYKKSIIMNLLK